MGGPNYELWSNERLPSSNLIGVYPAVDRVNHGPLPGYTDNMGYDDPPHLATVSSFGTRLSSFSRCSQWFLLRAW